MTVWLWLYVSEYPAAHSEAIHTINVRVCVHAIGRPSSRLSHLTISLELWLRGHRGQGFCDSSALNLSCPGADSFLCVGQVWVRIPTNLSQRAQTYQSEWKILLLKSPTAAPINSNTKLTALQWRLLVGVRPPPLKLHHWIRCCSLTDATRLEWL